MRSSVAPNRLTCHPRDEAHFLRRAGLGALVPPCLVAFRLQSPPKGTQRPFLAGICPDQNLLFAQPSEQASHGGELAAAVGAGLIGREHVTQLGDVLAGTAEGHRSADEITLFDSTGLAIQDLAIAKVALAKADQLDLPRLDL